jgi:hypothetical protein
MGFHVCGIVALEEGGNSAMKNLYLSCLAVLGLMIVGVGAAGNALGATLQLPMDFGEWTMEGVGSISEVPEGIKISSEGYTRNKTVMVSATRADLVGQEAFIKWKPDGNGGYACYSLGFSDDIDEIIGFQASVGNTWSGCRNTLLSHNTQYYTRFKIYPDGTYEITTSTGNYDGHGGTKVADQSGTLGIDALDRLGDAFVSINQNDNHRSYASTVVSEVMFDDGLVATITSCTGFEPPMDTQLVTAKGNRALPLKAQLFDAGGFLITDTDILAAPVLQVMFQSETGGTPEDVTDLALPAGFGTEGNQFVFTDELKWQYNLKTKDYTASGTYTISIVSGDEAEYVILPACETSFVRN